jgi:bis(5'-nucleosidyl)-tetraphosphatase
MMEHSAGCIVFDVSEKPVKVLIIQQKNGGHFGFPKGHLNPFESTEEAAIRETKEEVGLDVELTHHYMDITYEIKPNTLKTVTYFVAITKSFDINIQQEEILSASFLNVSDAFQTLTYQNDKDVLELSVKIINDHFLR